MKKFMIYAAALGAALAFASPASAKNGKHHGWNKGYKHGHYMPMRSNRGGYLRGRERARYVHRLNRMKHSRY